MVTLVSEKNERQLTAQQEATRSGGELVPVIVRDAGPEAVESFLSFFARAKSMHTGYVYRSAANHFFRWCIDCALDLRSLKAGHVAGFFEKMEEEWKTSTAKSYFRALRYLFEHLQADHIIEQSPFVGVAAPRGRGALKELKRFLLDGYGEDSEFFRPGLVAMFPIFVGGMDERKISAVTGFPLEEVETYVGRLRANGIWTDDGKIAVDFEDPEKEADVATVNMALIIGCAAGVFQRFPADEVLADPAAEATT